MSHSRGATSGPAALTAGDPREIRTAAELAGVLTDLRLDAGLSIRDVARRSGMAVSTVGGYFSGRHLPPATRPDVLEALLEVLGVGTDPEAWHHTVRRLHRGGPRTVFACPYPGDRTFDTTDAACFHGRADLTARVVAAVRAAGGEPAARVVAVVGDPGAGTSSLLRAGLVPAVGPAWRTEVVAAGDTVTARVRAATSRLDGDGPAVLVLDRVHALLPSPAAHRARTSTAAPEAPLDDAAAAVALLDGWLAGSPERVLVLGLRSDHAPAARRIPLLRAALARPVVVTPMTPAELEEVVRRPAERSGAPLDDGLVALLLADCAEAARRGTPALPHLARALFALWEDAGPHAMTVERYVRAGRLAGTAARAAERAWTTLPAADRPAARHVLLRCVAVEDDLGPVAVEVPVPHLPARTARALEHLLAARVLAVHEGAARLGHDGLVTDWPRLAAWLEEERERMAVRRVVTREAAAWLAAGRHPGLLLRGPRLASVSAWSAEDVDDLAAHERELVAASIGHAEAHRRAGHRRVRRLRLLNGAAGVATALAVAASAARTTRSGLAR
jgi:transcriptional regulator with XRE-family HTH domain